MSKGSLGFSSSESGSGLTPPESESALANFRFNLTRPESSRQISVSVDASSFGGAEKPRSVNGESLQVAGESSLKVAGESSLKVAGYAPDVVEESRDVTEEPLGVAW